MGKRGAKKAKTKSKGGKGKGKGGKGVKKKLKADAGAKGKGDRQSKGGKSHGKTAGKGSGKEGKKEGDSAKGKGKGKAPPGAAKLTRKERKKASIARAKGYYTPEAPKPKAAPLLGQVKKKGKKRLRPGQSKRSGSAAPKEEAAKPQKKVRVRNRSSPEEKVEQEAFKCKKGHNLGHRSDNPATYVNQACCDVCGKEDLPKLCSKGKLSHFFHCSFCKFDICPACATSRPPREKKPKKLKTAPKAKSKPLEVDAVPRVRRELWIPTEAESVNRAPTMTEVLSDWVEGRPV